MSSWHNHHHYHLKILHIDALSFGLQSSTLAGLLTNIKISAEVGPKVVQEQIRTRVVEKFLCSNFILSVDSRDLKIEYYQKCTFKTLYIVCIFNIFLSESQSENNFHVLAQPLVAPQRQSNYLRSKDRQTFSDYIPCPGNKIRNVTEYGD